jgi:hypothetical protein
VFPLGLWLALWAGFGLPFGDIQRTPQVEKIQWNLNPLRRPDDVAVNFLFYAPFGAMCASWGWPLIAAAATGASLSGATEAVQLFAPSRVPSLRDFILNSAGAIFGYAAWAAWRRSVAAKRGVSAPELPYRRTAA